MYSASCNKARYEPTSLNMNGSFETKEEVLHTRNSGEIPFWRPAERAWNVFLDRIQRAVKKHRDREKLVEWKRETKRSLYASICKKDRGRRTGKLGKKRERITGRVQTDRIEKLAALLRRLGQCWNTGYDKDRAFPLLLSTYKPVLREQNAFTVTFIRCINRH